MYAQFKSNRGKIHFKPLSFAVVAFACLLVSCGSTEPSPSARVTARSAPPANPGRMASLERQAESMRGAQAAELLIQAADLYLLENSPEEAAAALERIASPSSLPEPLQLRVALARARTAQAQGQLRTALRWLTGTLASSANPASPDGANFHAYLAGLYLEAGQAANALRTYAEITASLQHEADSEVFDQIWFALQELDEGQLQALAGSAASYELRGWIELARVYRNSEFTIPSQLDALARWRAAWSRHTAARRLPQALADLQSLWDNRPRHIALLLPTQQQSGLTIQEGFFSAYYAALAAGGEVPKITVIDSSDALDVFSLYDDAVSRGADLVIGPLNKSLVNQYRRRAELPVPTLALNYLDGQEFAPPSLPSAATALGYSDTLEALPRNLFQFGLAPEDEIKQLADLAWNAGLKNAAVLTPASADYLRLQNAFSETWQQLGGRVVSTASFTETNDFSATVKRLMSIDSSEARARRIRELLPRDDIRFEPRRRQDIDFIFLIANPRQGRLIKPTFAFYFAENVPVYSLPSINEGRENPNENRDLNGVWFVDAPWLVQEFNPLKTQVTENLRPASGQLQRLRALGIDSFRLYARLDRMAGSKISRIPGATGLLTMNPDGTIHRRLNVARFVNGQVVAQDVTIASSD